MMQSEDFMGYSVVKVSCNEVVDDLLEKFLRLNNGKSLTFACLNPHSYVTALYDDQFQQALKNVTCLVPDGVGIILGGKLLQKCFLQKITGYDFFVKFSEELQATVGENQAEFRVFFLGSTEQTLSRIEHKFAEDFPKLKLVGVHSPSYGASFSDNENLSILKKINRSNADVLWVGMTAPKQEKWVETNKNKLNVKFIGSIGAVFDYYAGNTVLPPKIIRIMGFEWIYRLLQEPRRLWRRTIVSAPIFVFRVLRARAQQLVLRDKV
jgi:N-acetylglucosaminyldiphosphoundecaprenol N-acetyl-beta-D-mannosaminyltransferase